MMLKSLIAALTVTVATSSIAAADVSFRGSVSGQVSIYSDSTYSTPYTQPAIRDHRSPRPVVVVRDHRRSEWRKPAPLPRPTPVHVIEPAQPAMKTGIEMNARGFTTIETLHLGGTPDHLGQVTIDTRHVRHLNQLQFGWTHGNTSIKQVVVRYSTGVTKVYNVSTPLTQNPRNRVSPVIQLDRTGREFSPVDSITVIGYGFNNNSQFSLMGRLGWQ